MGGFFGSPRWQKAGGLASGEGPLASGAGPFGTPAGRAPPRGHRRPPVRHTGGVVHRIRATISRTGAERARSLRAMTLVWGLVLAMASAEPVVALGPRAVITGGPQGETISRDARFDFAATSGTPFARFDCRLDGGPWTRCDSPTTYTGLVGGRHRFEVRLGGFLVDRTPAVRDWVVALGTQTLPCRLAQRCPNPLSPQHPGPRPRKRRDAGGCAYGGDRVGEVSNRKLSRAVACLVSKARASRGLQPLYRNRALEAAAAAHGRDMVAKRYYSHVSRDGRDPTARIRRVGYLCTSRFWAIGEVMVFTRPSFTPSRVVSAWLRSPTHRSVILTPAFRHIGAAIVRGTPTNRSSGATCVADLGRRG